MVGTGAVLLFTGGSAARAEKLTLEKSIEYALEHNPVVRIARENVRKTAAYIDEASAAGMPKLDLEATYMRLDRAATATISGKTVELNVVDNRAADLSLRQPLDVFGIIELGKRMAHLGRVSAQFDYDQVWNDTALQVKEAYYAVLRAQQQLKVREDAVLMLEAHLKDARTHHSAGTIAKFDVLRAETELANARQGLIAAQNGVDLAKAGFNNVLGRELDAPVDLEEPGAARFVELDVAACTDSACSTRPEVRRADTQVELSDKMIDIAKHGSKPKVDLLWTYNRNLSVTIFNPRPTSWRAFLIASMPLYDGGKTKAAVQQAECDAENAKSGREQAILAVTLDVKQSYLSLNEGRERILAAEKGLEQARESMRLAQVRYRGGVSTQVEVMDARAALTLAETNYVNALYDYHIATARLERAVGGKTQMAKLIEHGPTVGQANRWRFDADENGRVGARRVVQ